MAASRRIQLQEALKLALSVTLFYWLALSLNWPSPSNGVIAIAVTSLATIGDSLNKGLLRIVGTALGVVAGLLITTLFAQSRWGFMLAMSAYFIAVSYLALNSRYIYAWFLAAMTAPIVWSSGYPDFDGAFLVGLSRFVETAGGVVVYTVVSLAVWPRSAAGQVGKVGGQLLEGLRELCRREGAGGEPPEETEKLRASVAGLLPAFDKALAAAFSDTPSIKARAGTWRVLSTGVRSFDETRQLFRLSVEDNRSLDLDRLIPDLDAGLETVGRRLDRVVELWNTRDDPAATEDCDLLSPVRLVVRDADGLSHLDRMRLTQQVRGFGRVDETSRALLTTVRVLAGLEEPARGPRPPAVRPSRWDPERLLQALFPALCFVATYLFWIYTNPPAGNGITTLGVAFGMLLMLVPMNLFKILKLLLIGIAAASPLYMFVLPRLDSGVVLLGLVFVTTFLLGLLGGRLAMLRTLGLICFALITNITNRQSYSFLGVLYPAIMMSLGTVVVMLVYWFIGPMHPEKVLLRSVGRFFRGCARMMRLFAGNQPEDQAQRGHVLRSQVLPANRRLRGALQGLDYARFPDNTKERVQRMADALQLTLFRIQAIEAASHASFEVSGGMREALGELRGAIERVFRAWSQSPEAAISEDQRAPLERLAEKLRGEFDGLLESGRFDEGKLLDFWALLGCLRGLIETMNETQDAMKAIRWDQWTIARF